jgi:hypothetical protein
MVGMRLRMVHCFCAVSVFALSACGLEKVQPNASQKAILDDFKLVAQFAETYRKNNNKLPSENEFDIWLKRKSFKVMHYTDRLGMPISVTYASPGCFTGKEQQSKCKYKIEYTYDSGMFVDDYWYEVPSGNTNLPLEIR